MGAEYTASYEKRHVFLRRCRVGFYEFFYIVGQIIITAVVACHSIGVSAEAVIAFGRVTIFVYRTSVTSLSVFVDGRPIFRICFVIVFAHLRVVKLARTIYPIAILHKILIHRNDVFKGFSLTYKTITISINPRRRRS